MEGTDLQGALCIKNLYSKKKKRRRRRRKLRILFVFRRALLISRNHMLVLRPIQMKVLFVYFLWKDKI